MCLRKDESHGYFRVEINERLYLEHVEFELV